MLFSCAVCVAAASGLAWATPQAGQTGHRSGFKLYSGALAAGVDNGIITQEGTVVEDNVLAFVPMAIAYRSQSPRSDLQFAYEPEFDIFETHTELNAWNQAAAVRYSLEATRDVSLRTGGSFLYTHDRDRRSSGVALSPYGLYVEGNAYFSVDYRLKRETSVSVGANSRLTNTAVLDSTSASGSIETLTSSFTARLSRSFGSTHQVSIGYVHLVSTLLNPDDLAQGGNVADRRGQGVLNFGYTLSLSSGLRLAASGGAIRSPQDVGSDQYTYSMSGRVDKIWSSVTVGGGYSRSLAGLFQLDATDPADQIRDPLLSRNVAERVDFTLVGRFGRRLRIDHQIGLSRTRLQNSDERLEALYAGVYAGFVVADRLVPFVTFSYWDQNATEFGRPVSRTRVMAGLRFYWDSPSIIPASREHESVRSILPVRRVQ